MADLGERSRGPGPIFIFLPNWNQKNLERIFFQAEPPLSVARVRVNGPHLLDYLKLPLCTIQLKFATFRNEKLGNRPSELLLRLLGQRKNWPIADLRVPTNDLRNNFGTRRPFSSYKNTHFQNEAKYNTFLDFLVWMNFEWEYKIFFKSKFALSLALTESNRATGPFLELV